MHYDHVLFSGHAVQQMFYREITKKDVIEVIENGNVIASYSGDKPYPSCLKLGFVNEKPIHVVFAVDNKTRTAIVVTTYIPDSNLWSEDFSSRRNKL